MRFLPGDGVSDLPRVTEKQIRVCIARFEETGRSSHSTMGLLLAPLLNHCVANGIPFTLTFVPYGGYELRREKL